MGSADFSAEVAISGQTGLCVYDLFSIRRKGTLKQSPKAWCIVLLSNAFVFNGMTVLCGLDMSKPVLKVAITGQPTLLSLRK